ncbi:MAG: SnoaL-like domain-containing protein [Bacteroidota bacterium]
MMTTTDIANRFLELCRKQDWQQIYSELYSQDAESVEPPGTPWPNIKGLDAFANKGEKWQSMIEEHHGMEVSDALITDNFFVIKMTSENTMKGMGRVKFEELCMYEVQNSKIIKEQFFYTPQD